MHLSVEASWDAVSETMSIAAFNLMSVMISRVEGN